MDILALYVTRILFHAGRCLHGSPPSAKHVAGLKSASHWSQVPKLLGGVRVSRNLRLICLEEPGVFSVQSQVRLWAGGARVGRTGRRAAVAGWAV